MIKETYERLSMDVTKFDAEDVIVTSGIENPAAFSHQLTPTANELPVGVTPVPLGF